MHRELILLASMIKILRECSNHPADFYDEQLYQSKQKKVLMEKGEKRNLWLNTVPAFSKETEISFSVSI